MEDCPSRGELQRLISGSLPPDRQQFLERHLETCGHCRRRIETLADVRSVVPNRPGPGRGQSPESPALKRAMEQLQADPDPEAAVGTAGLDPAAGGQWARPP